MDKPGTTREELLRAALQKKIRQQVETTQAQERIKPADRSQPLPLSLAQQRLWFLDRLDPAASAAYHMPSALRLLGRLDVAALQATLDRLVARHEGLRTSFVAIDGVPYQQIAPEDCGFALRREDWSHLPAGEREALVARLTAEEARAPFDLSKGPLIRGRLLTLADDEHVLLITQHHIVSDGWSLNIVVREVAALYTAFSRGEADPLPPLEIQYADYAQWQRQWLQGEELTRQFEFWKTHLAGAPALLELPADRPRPALQSHAGGAVPFMLSAELTSDLRAFSQRHGVTLFMTLLSAWGLLLSRLSGQADVVIGTPVANRQRREVENLIGFFVNTLAVRLRFEEQPSVEALLAQAKEATLAAFAHQELPFDQVVEAVQPQRSLSHGPLFQTMLGLNNIESSGDSELELPGLRLAPVRGSMTSAQHDLSINLSEAGERLSGVLEYGSDLFDRTTVERWGGYYVRLLEGMVADASAAVDSLPLLSAAERQQQLYELNATQAAYPKDKLIHELFEEQAAARPDAPAVVFEDQIVSYGELNTRANQLAHELIALGVQPDDRVAICVERGLDMVVGLLGILKAGGAYLPLDPAYPVERLQFMLQDGAPKAFLTQRALQRRLYAGDVPTVLLDRRTVAHTSRMGQELREKLSTHPTHNPDARAHGLTPRSLAYVIYTSGSTGTPKGVMVEHGNVVNMLTAYAGLGELTSGDRVLQFASFGFDSSVAEMFPAWSAGAAVVLREAEFDLDHFVSFLNRHRVSVVDLPTAVWRQWSQHLNSGAPGACESLRLVIVSGETMESRDAGQWFSLPGSDRIVLLNNYGPTEATVNATACAVEPSLLRDGQSIPIGRPIANTQIYVLDARREPVPAGVEGEIYIGGGSVARGYLNRPDLTAERFLRDPFGADPAARMYRTGDLGRWLADGNIQFRGRNDFQVKIRGFRIELGEIEAKLSQCAGVREAVVIAREDMPGDKRLVAYLVAEDGANPQTAELRAALLSQLPEYMVPAAFVMLEALPLTANGKLDRKALPAPERTALVTRQYEAPQGEIEEALAALWQEMLRVERVGRHDQFFELGGHSLLVVAMVDRLRALGWSGEVRAVFASPTLSAYAATLQRNAASQETAVPPNPLTPDTTVITPELLPLVTLTQAEIDLIVAAVPGGVGNIQDIYPLLALQEGMLFHHLLETEGDTYLLRDVIAFDSKDRLDRFLAVLQQLIARHDILRTAVAWEGLSTPVQVVFRDAPLPIETVVLSGEGDALEELRQRTDPHRVRLDLRRAPLLAAYVAEDAQRGEWLLSLLSHHMVGDHETLELVMADVRALLRDEGHRLMPSLPLRNLVAQSSRVAPSEHEAYFREQLAGVDAPTAPFGILNVQAKSTEVETVGMRLDDDLARRLRDCAGQLGVPPSVLFHVGWAQVLARCTGRSDVVFGTVLSGRLQGAVGADRALGMFINTLPLRVSLEGAARQVVQESYQRMVSLLAHEQAPLALAQRCSGVPSPLPLFTTLLNFRHSVSATAASTADLEGIRLLSVHEAANYPLVASVDDFGREFSLKLQCLRALDVRRVLRYLVTALHSLVSALETETQEPLVRMDVLPAEERATLLYGFNATHAEYPDGALIHELFEQQAAVEPDAVAVVFEDQTLSYGELNARANQLAHELIALGVQPDDRVAICAERSLEMVVGLLGILKAGGAYLPLDPAYPTERLQFMLRDAAPRALLTQQALQQSLPVSDVQTLWLDSDEVRIRLSAQPTNNPEARAQGLTARNLAYVIYTSGSTGIPKGVMVDHRCVNRLVINNPYFEVTRDDCFAHCANPAFDATTWEVWGALLNGARLLVLPPSAVMDPAQLNATLYAGGVTALWLTVGLFNQYVDQLPDAFGQLRYLLVGGDALDPKTIRQLLGREQRPAHIVNGYGPTETTTFAITHDIRAVADDARSIPLGKPIANTQIYILDAHGEPVPVGVEGEIYIGGDGVARGYLNRVELTAERFLRDPFRTDAHSDAGARMYKTGDRGRWLADGTIEFLGRNDFQVKIRGFRIELGEIEAKLSQCSGLRDAVVLAREDAPGDKRLVAYLVADEGFELSVAELREALARQLPDYMVPSAFVQLDALPLTANGKLDRRALPAPEATALQVREYEAPQGEIEEALAKLWQELLRVERVGRHDNFFELGGHSLLAVQLISHIRATLHVELPLLDLFAAASVSALADAVRAAGASTHGRIEIADRSRPLPLSLAQQRLWFLDQLDKATSEAYHMPAALRMLGQLDAAALQATLDRLVARHEGLRTSFVALGGVPYQQIAPADCGFVLRREDLSHVSAAERRAVVAEHAAAEARAPFDLSTGPLIRGRLLTLADDNHVLLITQHHIVSDGWSLNVLVREVAALYTAFSRGEADPLSPLEIQYADYAQWQRQWLQGEELTRQFEFWKTQLAGAPALLELPTDRPRPALQSHAGGTVPVVLSAELTSDLRAFSQRHGVTLFMTLLSAWGVLLSRLSGQTDVVIGTPVANRQRREVEDLIGFFVNTLAVRLRLDEQPSVESLLAQVKETTLAAFAHQELPFEQVVEALQPQRSLSYSPLAQVTFTWNNLEGSQTDGGGGLELPGLKLAPLERGYETTQVDLQLLLDDTGDMLAGGLVYASALFDRTTIERWAGHYVRVLEAMVADPSTAVDALPLLSAAERRDVVEVFNDTDVDYPREALIQELFEQHVAQRPDAVAVIHEDEALTYGELNPRANQLAHYLIGLGVKPDDRVAICCERNIELIVGLLGILKAGGAYVPLDPSYPQERLAWMLEDSAPVALLIHSDLETLLPETELPVLRLDVDVPVLARRLPVHNPEARAHGLTARNLAYVIYTSGSTGTPKGVMVDHRCVSRLVLNNPYFEATAEDCFAHCANPAFDAATWEIWGALLNGARLLVVPSSVVMDPAQLNARLYAGGVTALWLTVGLFNQYVDQLQDAFGQLRYLLVGGDALDPKTIRQLLEREHRPVHVLNGYGPTETTTFAITHDIRAVAEDARSIPLGKPIANTQIYVLDPRSEPVPVGVEGEIYIGGDGVARGYLNRSELTAERFLHDPFRAGADTRMYKTGDRGRWLADGTVEFLGRNDFQVKIRGFRIELGEIEAKLRQCGGVRDAVVLAREDAPGDKRLVAYLVADDAAELSVSELRDALSRQLPEYMLPSAFVRLDALPLTANGKLDRQALPAPEATALSVREYEAPQGEIEETIAALWQELLKVPRVGRRDNFFELGGHSLLAVQLISHIRAALHVELPLRELFATSSLSALADAVSAAGASTLGRIEIADRSQPLPLSLAQQRLWFLDQLDQAASAAYHMPAALRLIGRLDVAALQATLDRLVARHEGLRTCFVAIDGVPYQRIAPEECGFALTRSDLRGLDDDSRARVVTGLTAEEARAPFDLSTGPLIRGRLLQVSDDEHVLLVTQHHIVSDGWSLSILVREVAALYTAFSRGEADPLPPLDIQYADYAQWQRQWLQGEELTRQFDFWKAHLAGAPALLALPVDRPRPAVQSYAGGMVPFRLPAELTSDLRALSQRHGVTLFMTLLSGWGLLLSRLSGQADVVIGTPVANRQRREVEDLIGFFVNTLAVRLRLDEQPSVEALLAQVKETTLAAFAHQELPFEQVVEAVQPQRSQSHSPLAQVTFTWNNLEGSETDGGALELPGLKLAPVSRGHETTQVDLQLLLDDAADVLTGGLVYASALFDRTTIERWAGHYVRVLEAMAADATVAVDALPLLSWSERQQVLREFNATEVAYPEDRLIHELFERHAALQPDAVAVVYDDESLTYAELNTRANQLAHYLIGQGVGPDARVAICCERNTDLIVGLLGILKAGGAYVPLDPSYPQERLAWMLEDSAPVALLIQSEVEELIPETEIPVLRLDGDVPVLARRMPAHNPAVPGLHARHLAYVIYTSGSTGTPKGVMVDHRCVNRLVINNPYFEATSGDCFAHCANPAFDAATWEIWGALLNGARLLVVPPSVVMDPSLLNAALYAGGVTALWLTVGLFNQYVDAMPDAFGQLRYLLVGGDALDPKTIRQLLGREQRPAHIVNGYGPTETTTFAITHDLRAVAEDARSIPLGKPIANTQIYILDPRGEPVPVGVEGEIYIGGDGVARGYLNRPELTAERFLRDPFSDDTGARMYKTGDRGRWLADGTIEFLGRHDFQVKIRGFRIELGEIEAKLGQCAGVRDAVVLAREDAPGDKRLVAYLVAEEGFDLSVADLREALARQLPEYMVPSAFVQLDALPLTANGKLDRQALPAPEATALHLREYEAPEGPIEEALAALWQELLRVERVGRHDNFFELGGHSLLAVQLISHIRAALHVELPLRELFATPSLSALADAVRAAGASTLGRIEIADRSQPLPLSLAQQRLWFLDQLDKAASAAYHMPAALRLHGRLDLAALEATLHRLVARHEVLRTYFKTIDGVPYQQMAPEECGFALRREDLSALPAEEREAAVARLTAEEARAPFDLSTGPLIRGRLLRVSDDEHVLLITQHHIVSDGWSLNVLVREVAALYTAFSRGEGDPLPPLEIQYADYAQWQRQWLQGEELTRQFDFWRTHLAGAPALLELPADRPRPALQSYAGGTVPFRLSAELTSELRAFSQRHGATLFMTLLSGWGLLLSRLSGQADVVIGTPVANRQRREVENLIGFFVNTLALRVSLGDTPSVEALLAQVKETTLAAFAHQELPFDQVVEALQPQRSLSHGPLFQTMLALNNTETSADGELQLPGLRLAPAGSLLTTAQHDLALNLTDTGETLSGFLDFGSDLFDRTTVERWAGYYARLLEAMVSDTSAAVDTLPLMSASEWQQQVYEHNATQAAYPKEKLIHELFEDQAAVRPDAPAVVFEEQSLSYGELNARANQLAHELIALGVEPDDRVAISVERGLDMVVGLLGILKAGGAYLPLDPAYPAERRQYMLQDAAPKAVLTQQELRQAKLSTQPASNPEARALGLTPRNLAYVIYTSGSTGTPKGVMVEHGSVVNMLTAHARTCGLTSGDRVLQFASFGFDSSVAEIFPALSVGATLVLRQTDFDLDHFASFLDRHRVSVTDLPTAVWRQWSQTAPACESLRLVIVSGETLESRDARQWFSHSGIALVNNYGPTETTVNATAYAVEPSRLTDGQAIPIGRPIANTRIYILDPRGEPVPAGVEGEIYIGGDGVARGYLNRPEWTAERFLRDPFSDDPGARMYKTGDLGRRLADGNLEFRGRNDFQVKIRGFRIEPGEIEAKLTECAGVREAVVIARDQRLVAYLVADEGVTLQAAELRTALSAQLPEYMIPSAFVALDAMPLTSNGKLDRKALPAPDATALAAREYEAPEGEVEETLAAIWQDLLKTPRVGRHDHFFELGGHSLLAVQLVSRIRAALGVELPLRALFAGPSLSALAGAVSVAGASTMEHIQRADRSQALPLSLAQQRLWFLDQLDPSASAAYHMAAALRLIGKLDVVALQATLDRLVARHESLRTSFVAVDGVPYQRIAAEDCGFALALRDLRALDADTRDRAVTELTAVEARAPFDLSTGPQIRGQLIALAEDEHVLLITQHHIVSDGWSLGILVREVAALYAAFSRGDSDPLTPLEIQYADYAQWQRRWLQGDELTRQYEFWKNHLTGAPALLDLPLDRPRPAVQSHAGGTVSLLLSPALTAGLRDLSQRHGVTLFMTLLSAWGLLLSRLSGQTDVVIGTPVANRQRREVENLIGFFVNTLALRLRFDEQPAIAALLAQIKETTLGAFAHQELPFEQVVEAVQPQRSLSHSPLFQTMLAFDNMPEEDGDGALRLPDLTLAPAKQALTTAQYELSLNLSDGGQALSGTLVYATDLFEHETMQRWTGYFVQILESMVADASVNVDALPLLSSAERRQLLVDFNATEAAYPRDTLIHELIEQQAAAQPDAAAVVFEDQFLTYAELNARANQLAHELIAMGVRPDDRVAICAERGFEMVVGLLGILKAGGAYVPLDPAYPIERLRYMLHDAVPKVLLTQQAVQQSLPASDVRTLLLNSESLSAQPATNPSPRQLGLTPQHLAYVIYTSGSTGLPKGVAIEHATTANLLHWALANFTEQELSNSLFSTSINFDLAVYELFVPLAAGSTLTLVRNALALTTGHEPVTLINTVPSAIKALLDAGGVPASTQLVNLAGEPLKQGIVERLFAETATRSVANLYGPSETTTYSTWVRMAREEGFVSHIGRPIANTQVYILDAHREPVPMGVAGEIYIGGDGVARGYLNRPELTAERFLRDPFREAPNVRMYKTGDLGRWLPDGNIEYLGRNDFQVKIRGFRIELGEIEAKLSQCAGVREAVVVAREDVPGDKRLVAYLVVQEEADVSVADLRDALSRQLPEYMIPSAFVQLDAMPLTANGKLDRQALPAPDSMMLAAREYVPPQGEIEETLAALWQELLRAPRVGRHDNFFELGGHSLLAVQLISRIRATLGVDIALRDVFAKASLQALAEATRDAVASTLGRIQIADRSRPLPLSLAQQRLWFLDQLDKAASVAYHMPAALRLIGKLDVPALQATLDRLVARHEILRTSFVALDGLPYQQIAAEDCGFALTLHDLRALDDATRDRAVTEITADEARAPFDLSTGPLIRGQLLTVSDEEHVLLITQHHVVSDGWSLNVLVEEVAALYTAFSRGEADPLPPLEIQYADFAQWQRNWLQGEELTRQFEFWKHHLTSAPELLNLPLDHQRPALQSYAGDSVPLVLSRELTASLRALSQRHGATLFMTLLSAWGLLLSRLSGQSDVVIGTPVANRQRREVENLIGFFVNTLALRLRFDQQPSVAALLGQVKETMLAAFAHQELPFEQVVEAVQITRSISHSPLFQAMLAFNNTSDGEGARRLPDLRLAPAKQALTTAQYELSLNLTDGGEELTGSLVYASALFDRSTVERWAGYFVRLLEAMVADASAQVDALPLLSSSERRQLLVDFNATETAYPKDTLIHELFEQQAAAQPDAAAVVFEDQFLTYAELNGRANQLAHELIALGVRPDDRVAICAERGFEMVVGLLGILKAGGAYVPLDPAYPIERLRYMLQDAAPQVLLTQQALQQSLPASDVRTLLLNSETLSAQPATNPIPRQLGLTPQHLAYVIYTSGSTGLPKGVAIEHANTANLLHWALANFSEQELSNSLFSTSINFDLAVYELFVPLAAGSTLTLVRNALALTTGQEPVTLINTVPSAIKALLDAGGVPASTQLVNLAGEPLKQGIVERLFAETATRSVANLYGPSETTTYSTWVRMTREEGFVAHIGRPIANTQVYILDAHREPVPMGVAGEIYIGGDGVARGYLNRPELTAERFLRDPFRAAPNARMYKTGDLGRWLPDGNIEYLGRNDFQVKIRGFRIELGEIEAKLSQCAGVREAVVMAREDVPGDKRLVAYLVVREAADVSVADLRDALSRQLPEYMIPSAFVQLDAMPLTANGKLDRQALPAPDSMMLAAREYVPPQGEIEETLAALWQELLGGPGVGRHDNFFELGGHSLLVVQFMHRLEAQTPYRVAVRDLFQHSSLMELAAHISAASAKSSEWETRPSEEEVTR